MGPGELVRRRERDVGPEQGLDAHRRGHARRCPQAVGIGQEQRADRGHQLGPVEEREALLGAEHERFQAGCAEGDERRHDLAVHLHLAPADQRQGEVGQRREVARCAHGPLGRNERVDPSREEREQPLDHDCGATAAVAERQGVGAEQEHRPDDLAVKRSADARRVAHQEVLLEPFGIRRGDEPVGKRAEAGRDAVDDVAVGDEPLDQVARLLHSGPGRVVEACGSARAGDRLDVGDREIGAGQDDRLGRSGRQAVRSREAG